MLYVCNLRIRLKKVADYYWEYGFSSESRVCAIEPEAAISIYKSYNATLVALLPDALLGRADGAG